MRGRAKGTLEKEGMLVLSLFLLILYIVKTMLYAFGDVANPVKETADLLEEIVTNFIADIVCISFIISH